MPDRSGDNVPKYKKRIQKAVDEQEDVLDLGQLRMGKEKRPTSPNRSTQAA